MGNPRSRLAATFRTSLSVWLLGGCISGPQFEDFLITEFSRVVSDVAAQVFGAFITASLPVQ